MASLIQLDALLGERLAGNRPIRVHGFTPPARGLFLASLLNHSSRTILVVTANGEEAERIVEDVRFFLNPKRGEEWNEILLYSPWEILPYEDLSPYFEISSSRINTLIRLSSLRGRNIVVTTVTALLQKIVPEKLLRKSIRRFRVGDRPNRERLTQTLVRLGYRSNSLVEDKGEFSFRGNILDIYSPFQNRPTRMELMGDEIESIRFFHPETQRSIRDTEEAVIVPFREVWYSPEAEEGLGRYGSDRGEGETAPEWVSELLDRAERQEFWPGMEKHAIRFFGELETLFDYLPDRPILVLDEFESVESKAREFFSLVNEEYEKSVERGRFYPPPKELYLNPSEFESLCETFPRIGLVEFAEAFPSEGSVHVSVLTADSFSGRLEDFTGRLREWIQEGFKAVLVCHTLGTEERMVEILAQYGISGEVIPGEEMQKVLHRLAEAQKNLFERNLYVVVGGLSAGFVLPEDRWIFITEEEIFGPRRRLRTSRVSRREPFAVGLADLSEGDFVVHRDHGIGRYMGTEVLRIGDTAEEYLKVLYAEDQRLFIPMSSITLLQKYLGIGDSVPALDRMGGQTWKKTKSKIKKELKEIADALLALYAKREVASGHSFSTPNHFYDEFVDAFEFEETEDQRKSIDEVARDMELPRPMDRLVCGDVGYGKTEVAMRAAFKAVMDGKQVAVLVPTTLLAQQHYQTFTDRFRSFPVTIEMLSRFKTPAEQKEIVTRLNEGKVDIVIGTHRLLQKDIRFKDLGLLVIDEEHRFGVGHKEKLKTFRETVDVLTLTATPIPRTLHISLMGIRDMSVITTPPQDRLAIKTVVCKFDQAVIRQAILREMERGGQVFFVHNRVESIHAMGSLIKRLVPKARLAVAHGQMPEKDLESIMIRYVRREFDVLLSTTIIESGLDIPNANTIIINRADKFGLAQLYQLRGRVGRDRHRAYGYLLVPGMDALTPTAKKRLKAIQELSELGAGFQLAVRDMEIRGVGNILGPQQSGQICAVGFETYCHLLEEAIQDVKGTAEKEKLPETTVKLGYTGSIPSDYIPDVNQRMEWYRTLFALESDERFQTVRGEILDRYGKPPEEMERLFSLVRLRCLGRGLGIERMELDSDKVYLFFNRNTPVNREKLLEMIGQRRNWFRLISEDALQYFLKGEGWREVSDHVISGLIRLRTICD